MGDAFVLIQNFLVNYPLIKRRIPLPLSEILYRSMKLSQVLGEKKYKELMNWEDQHEDVVIRYNPSSDGNPNGLTVTALDDNDTVIHELTVYGENAVGSWLKAIRAQFDEWDRQLAEQGITPDQYNVGCLSCPRVNLFG